MSVSRSVSKSKSWWVLLGAVVVGLGVGACCTARAPASAEPVVSGGDGAGGQAEQKRPGGQPEPSAFERCTVARDFAGLGPDEGRAWREECRPAFDCERPLPPKVCCLALTPECLACSEEGQRVKAAFDYACFGETSPVPESFDCSQPPPLTACCRALTPKCLDCAARNRFMAEVYRQQCGTP